jgi:hypothetical protein
MMHRLALLAVFAATLGTPTAALAQEPGIERLDWLIGEWDFADAEIDGEYRETGTRVCEYTLGGDYIVCESEGTDHRGRTRSYVWYFNYNDRDERYEITSLFQGLGMKALYTAEVSDDGYRLESPTASGRATGSSWRAAPRSSTTGPIGTYGATTAIETSSRGGDPVGRRRVTARPQPAARSCRPRTARL